jgi:hypothetical protein
VLLAPVDDLTRLDFPEQVAKGPQWWNAGTSQSDPDVAPEKRPIEFPGDGGVLLRHTIAARLIANLIRERGGLMMDHPGTPTGDDVQDVLVSPDKAVQVIGSNAQVSGLLPCPLQPRLETLTVRVEPLLYLGDLPCGVSLSAERLFQSDEAPGKESDTDSGDGGDGWQRFGTCPKEEEPADRKADAASGQGHDERRTPTIKQQPHQPYLYLLLPRTATGGLRAANPRQRLPAAAASTRDASMDRMDWHGRQ